MCSVFARCEVFSFLVGEWRWGLPVDKKKSAAGRLGDERATTDNARRFEDEVDPDHVLSDAEEAARRVRSGVAHGEIEPEGSRGQGPQEGSEAWWA